MSPATKLTTLRGEVVGDDLMSISMMHGATRLGDLIDSSPTGQAHRQPHHYPQCRLLQHGRQVSPDEFVILVVPLVLYGE